MSIFRRMEAIFANYERNKLMEAMFKWRHIKNYNTIVKYWTLALGLNVKKQLGNSFEKWR
jgi:hypothetical protein